MRIESTCKKFNESVAIIHSSSTMPSSRHLLLQQPIKQHRLDNVASELCHNANTLKADASISFKGGFVPLDVG